jgi:hypothetical protein
MFMLAGNEAHQKQQNENAENGSESGVELPADTHKNRLAFFQPHAANILRAAVLLEINFNDLNGFLRPILEAPFLDGIFSFESQKGASAENFGFLYMAVGRNRRRDPNCSSDPHSVS